MSSPSISPRSSAYFTGRVSPSRPTIGVYEISAEKQERLDKLRHEFDEIDSNHDQMLTFEEVRSFLSKRSGLEFDEVLCQELFNSIDKDRDSAVSVDEFIMSYVQAAELMQTRIEQLDRQVSDNRQHLEEAKKKLEEARKIEKQNANGVMVGSTITCHVREAKSLKPINLRGTSDPYVELTCERQRIETKFLPGETNPVWDEVFTFQVEKKEANLLVAVMSKSAIGGDEIQGKVLIPLSAVEDQLKHDNYYDLRGKDGEEGKYGKIRLGLQWIWSKAKYFETIVKQWEENLDMDRQELEYLHAQIKKLDRPFGFLLEAKTLKRLAENSRAMDIQIGGTANGTLGSAFQVDSVFGEKLAIDWGFANFVAVWAFLAIAAMCMIARPSFLDVWLCRSRSLGRSSTCTRLSPRSSERGGRCCMAYSPRWGLI